jgi:anti-sigma regulatory factor (Ser/Thr protein kinase)
MSVQLSQPLSAGHAAVADARRVIDELGDRLCVRDADDLRLLVSELVTNAIRHGGADTAPWLELELADDRVLASVHDAGPGFDPPTAPQPSAAGGWGLLLVDALAERWGVERGRCARVWFELRLRQPAPERAAPV